jgi:hypothetical protein
VSGSVDLASTAFWGKALLRRQVQCRCCGICLLVSNQNYELAVDRSDTLERQEARLQALIAPILEGANVPRVRRSHWAALPEGDPAEAAVRQPCQP